MYNFKISGIAAGIAFILSFVIGLFGGVGIFALLLRAFIFAVLFFALFVLFFWLLAQFLPELLSGSEDDMGISSPGSRVDISLGDDSITGAFPGDNSEVVDDIAGKPSVSAKPAQTASVPLDQEENAGYNKRGGIPDGMDFGVIISDAESGMTAGAESILDIGSFAEVSPETGVDQDEVSFDIPEQRRPVSSSKKSEGMQGDFNPKELAQAIQTVLRRDDKG